MFAKVKYSAKSGFEHKKFPPVIIQKKIRGDRFSRDMRNENNLVCYTTLNDLPQKLGQTDYPGTGTGENLPINFN